MTSKDRHFPTPEERRLADRILNPRPRPDQEVAPQGIAPEVFGKLARDYRITVNSFPYDRDKTRAAAKRTRRDRRAIMAGNEALSVPMSEVYRENDSTNGTESPNGTEATLARKPKRVRPGTFETDTF